MKGPDRSHFIQRFKFDFEIERREDANRLQNALSRLFKDRLEPMIDRLLTKYDDPNFVTRIPEIEIDLGVILEDRIDSEVVIRFEQQFSRAISLRMAELKHATAVVPADRGERTALVPAQIEIITHYLMQGRLPMGAENMSGRIEQLFWDLLDVQPQNMLNMLKTVGRRSPKAMQRLATAFSDKLVERVYALAVNQNSLSIATYERQLAASVAKATEKPMAAVEAQLRIILLQYLLIEKPDSFQMSVMEEVVAEKLGKIFGSTAQQAVQKRSKNPDQDPQAKKTALEEGRIKEAAINLIAEVIKGNARSESRIAIIEAWEFLVARDVPALQRLIATQAKTPAALAELVEAIPVQALRDFVQRVSKTIGLRLIQLAATVASAHDLFGPTPPAQMRITQAIYAVLLLEVTSHPSASPRPEAMLEAIQNHLASLPIPPTELLVNWEQFDFVGPVPVQKPESQPAAAEAENLTPEQKIEAQRRAEAELKAIAEEEQKRAPMTPEERRAAAEKSRQEKEEAKLRAEAWEEEQSARLERIAKGHASDEDHLLSDEEFFKRGRELLRQTGDSLRMETIEDLARIGSEEELFLTPLLATVEGRADVVMHFLATGSAPWWAQRFIPMQVELLVKSLVQREPAAVQRAFVRIARSLPPERYPTFVQRIIELLSETTFTAILPLLAGDLGGFTVSLGLALQESIATLPESVSVPTTERGRRTFAYQHQLRYLMEYASSEPTPSQMLRYALKQMQGMTGLSSRRTIEWFGEVVETLVAKGERRFTPLKTMLPKVFEGLEVLPAQPHAQGADTLAFQRTLVDRLAAGGALLPEDTETEAETKAKAAEAEAKRVLEEGKSGLEEGKPSLEGKTGLEEGKSGLEEGKSSPEEGKAGLETVEQGVDPSEKTPDSNPATKTQTGLGIEPETSSQDPSTPEKQLEEALRTEGKDTPGISIDGAPEDASHLPETEKPATGEEPEGRVEIGKDKSTQPDAEDAKSIDEEIEGKPESQLTPAQKARKAASDKLREKMAAAFAPKPEAEIPAEPETMQLEPEEVEALGINEEWVIEVIRYYLLHGSLSPAATAMYTATTFREEIKVALASGTRPVIQMLRDIIGNRDVRQRLFALGEEVSLRAITLVNVAASDKMLPFVREMAAIFKGTSSPVTPAYVYEHAIQHAMGLRTTFLPINYMKAFFEFIAMQPGVSVKEAIIWANRRLESSSSPLRTSLDEMLDVVDRIEQLRDTRRQQVSPEDGKRSSAPAYIPSAMDEEIYVSNGGAGILYLFMITLFKAFNMITEDKKAFVDKQAQVRAIHQIQYLCYKEIDSPEEKMVLAKLIVGWPLDEPLEPLETALNEDDIDTCEAIMGMVCTQWGVMKNAGADYLRKTFIQREGRLKQEGSDWLLKVEQNGIDVLKNKIPWSTTPIRMPWLSYLIDIEWP